MLVCDLMTQDLGKIGNFKESTELVMSQSLFKQIQQQS